MYDRTSDINSKLVADFLREKRSEKRWRNFRFVCWFLLIAIIVFGSFSSYKRSATVNLGKTGLSHNYVALVRLDGMIAPGRDFSAENVLPTLRDAFSDKRAVGVVLDIDSPGGTPVQASIIHDAILQYKKLFNKKVIVVGEDMLTSGAYYVSVAADKIYVNPNTITGSVGVIMKGFGFVDTLKKLGIERRVYTSGTSKDRLDPFLPQNPEDVAKVQQVEAEVHQNFVAAVMEGRKGKLKGDPKDLFNGDFWSGQSAMSLGLVDEMGNLLDVMTKEFKTARYKEYGDNTPSFLKALNGSFNSAIDGVMFRLG